MAAKTYGYARISRPQQSIDRQIRNIKAEYPGAVIIQEAYTGTKMDRPEWSKLFKKVRSGDTIVFDSVSRMSRNADEGVQIYFELYENDVQLIFLKEHYIDTAVYAENMRDKIELQGTDEDEIFKGLNNYFRKLAERQIRIRSGLPLSRQKKKCRICISVQERASRPPDLTANRSASAPATSCILRKRLLQWKKSASTAGILTDPCRMRKS